MSYKLTYSGMPDFVLEFTAEDEKDLVQRIAFFQRLPKECPVCKAPVVFFFRTPKEFEYYGMSCLGRQTHKSNFGQLKKGGLFYKGAGSWEEDQYSGSETSTQGEQPPPHDDRDYGGRRPPEKSQPTIDDDDVPF